MENIPILEGISPDEVEQMRVCFGVREERFRADTVIYDISEGRGELGLLTAGSAVIQRIDRQGGRTILEHLPTGSVFGEMLMFENVAGDSLAGHDMEHILHQSAVMGAGLFASPGQMLGAHEPHPAAGKEVPCGEHTDP